MKVRTIKYYFSEGLKSVFKNGIMSLASIATVASCIFILLFSYCLASNVDNALRQLEKAMGVTAFIDDDISADQINELYNRINDIPFVSSIHYISADEALEEFRKDTGDDQGVIAGLKTDNPFPRSFTITIDAAENQEAVIAQLQNMVSGNEGLYLIRHAQETVKVFVSINNAVRVISLVIILSLGALSVVIITNTIMLTVNNRKNEINIMKYIGATDWFIRWPFIIEGMIIGLIGAIIPIAICFFGYNEVISLLQDRLIIIEGEFSYQSRTAIFVAVSPMAIALGFIIGTIGSSMSVRKHLNV